MANFLGLYDLFQRQQRQQRQSSRSPLERHFEETRPRRPSFSPLEREFERTRPRRPSLSPLEREFERTRPRRPSRSPLERDFEETRQRQPEQDPFDYDSYVHDYGSERIEDEEGYEIDYDDPDAYLDDIGRSEDPWGDDYEILEERLPGDDNETRDDEQWAPWDDDPEVLGSGNPYWDEYQRLTGPQSPRGGLPDDSNETRDDEQWDAWGAPKAVVADPLGWDEYQLLTGRFPGRSEDAWGDDPEAIVDEEDLKSEYDALSTEAGNLADAALQSFWNVLGATDEGEDLSWTVDTASDRMALSFYSGAEGAIAYFVGSTKGNVSVLERKLYEAARPEVEEQVRNVLIGLTSDSQAAINLRWVYRGDLPLMWLEIRFWGARRDVGGSPSDANETRDDEQWDAWGAPKAVVADPRDDGTWQSYDQEYVPGLSPIEQQFAILQAQRRRQLLGWDEYQRLTGRFPRRSEDPWGDDFEPGRGERGGLPDDPNETRDDQQWDAWGAPKATVSDLDDDQLQETEGTEGLADYYANPLLLDEAWREARGITEDPQTWTREVWNAIRSGIDLFGPSRAWALGSDRLNPHPSFPGVYRDDTGRHVTSEGVPIPWDYEKGRPFPGWEQMLERRDTAKFDSVRAEQAEQVDFKWPWEWRFRTDPGEDEVWIVQAFKWLLGIEEDWEEADVGEPVRDGAGFHKQILTSEQVEEYMRRYNAGELDILMGHFTKAMIDTFETFTDEEKAVWFHTKERWEAEQDPQEPFVPPDVPADLLEVEDIAVYMERVRMGRYDAYLASFDAGQLEEWLAMTEAEQAALLHKYEKAKKGMPEVDDDTVEFAEIDAEAWRIASEVERQIKDEANPGPAGYLNGFSLETITTQEAFILRLTTNVLPPDPVPLAPESGEYYDEQTGTGPSGGFWKDFDPNLDMYEREEDAGWPFPQDLYSWLFLGGLLDYSDHLGRGEREEDDDEGPSVFYPFDPANNLWKDGQGTIWRAKRDPQDPYGRPLWEKYDLEEEEAEADITERESNDLAYVEYRSYAIAVERGIELAEGLIAANPRFKDYIQVRRISIPIRKWVVVRDPSGNLVKEIQDSRILWGLELLYKEEGAIPVSSPGPSGTITIPGSPKRAGKVVADDFVEQMDPGVSGPTLTDEEIEEIYYAKQGQDPLSLTFLEYDIVYGRMRPDFAGGPRVGGGDTGGPGGRLPPDVAADSPEATVLKDKRVRAYEYIRGKLYYQDDETGLWHGLTPTGETFIIGTDDDIAVWREDAPPITELPDDSTPAGRWRRAQLFLSLPENMYYNPDIGHFVKINEHGQHIVQFDFSPWEVEAREGVTHEERVEAERVEALRGQAALDENLFFDELRSRLYYYDAITGTYVGTDDEGRPIIVDKDGNPVDVAGLGIETTAQLGEHDPSVTGPTATLGERLPYYYDEITEEWIGVDEHGRPEVLDGPPQGYYWNAITGIAFYQADDGLWYGRTVAGRVYLTDNTGFPIDPTTGEFIDWQKPVNVPKPIVPHPYYYDEGLGKWVIVDPEASGGYRISPRAPEGYYYNAITKISFSQLEDGSWMGLYEGRMVRVDDTGFPIDLQGNPVDWQEEGWIDKVWAGGVEPREMDISGLGTITITEAPEQTEDEPLGEGLVSTYEELLRPGTTTEDIIEALFNFPHFQDMRNLAQDMIRLMREMILHRAEGKSDEIQKLAEDYVNGFYLEAWHQPFDYKAHAEQAPVDRKGFKVGYYIQNSVANNIEEYFGMSYLEFVRTPSYELIQGTFTAAWRAAPELATRYMTGARMSTEGDKIWMNVYFDEESQMWYTLGTWFDDEGVSPSNWVHEGLWRGNWLDDPGQSVDPNLPPHAALPTGEEHRQFDPAFDAPEIGLMLLVAEGAASVLYRRVSGDVADTIAIVPFYENDRIGYLVGSTSSMAKRSTEYNEALEEALLQAEETKLAHEADYIQVKGARLAANDDPSVSVSVIRIFIEVYYDYDTEEWTFGVGPEEDQIDTSGGRIQAVALEDVANYAQLQLKNLVPVRTGRLQRSITQEHVAPEGALEYQNITVGAKVNYAPFVSGYRAAVDQVIALTALYAEKYATVRVLPGVIETNAPRDFAWGRFAPAIRIDVRGDSDEEGFWKDFHFPGESDPETEHGDEDDNSDMEPLPFRIRI